MEAGMDTTDVPPASDAPPTEDEQTPPEGERVEKVKRRRVFKFVVEHWVELIASILALATAVLVPTTVVVTTDRDDLEAVADELEDHNSTLRDEIDGLEQENEGLQEELDDMATTTTTEPDDSSDDPTTSLPDSRTPTDDTPEAYRQTGPGPVVINSGAEIDLDSLEPDWGVRGGGGYELQFGGSTVSGAQFAIVDHQPTIQECEAQTQIVSSVSSELTTPGRQLCVLTDEDRWAYVRIAAVEPYETIAFDILVWKLPTDL
jgi:hypothetical protein